MSFTKNANVLLYLTLCILELQIGMAIICDIIPLLLPIPENHFLYLCIHFHLFSRCRKKDDYLYG
jgi:hypothetical protein